MLSNALNIVIASLSMIRRLSRDSVWQSGDFHLIDVMCNEKLHLWMDDEWTIDMYRLFETLERDRDDSILYFTFQKFSFAEPLRFIFFDYRMMSGE